MRFQVAGRHNRSRLPGARPTPTALVRTGPSRFCSDCGDPTPKASLAVSLRPSSSTPTRGWRFISLACLGIQHRTHTNHRPNWLLANLYLSFFCEDKPRCSQQHATSSPSSVQAPNVNGSEAINGALVEFARNVVCFFAGGLASRVWESNTCHITDYLTYK